MPVLRHPVRERFAQLMASNGGRKKRDCLLEARQGNRISQTGTVITDTSMSVKANKMFNHPEVQERIAELRGTAADKVTAMQMKITAKVQMTLEKLITEADAVQAAAIKEKQYSAAIAALIAKAKLAGLWVEKSESKNANYSITDQPMSNDEWKQRFVDRPN